MKQIFTLLFSVTLLSEGVWAHRQHSAHVHGKGELSIAFDETRGQLTLHTPGESLWGFEHAARTSKERAAEKEALAKLESKMSQMVKFEDPLGCTFTKQKIETKRAGKHADVHAEFAISCEKKPQGQLLFSFTPVFPRLKNVEVQVLLGSEQKSLQVKTKESSLKLTP